MLSHPAHLIAMGFGSTVPGQPGHRGHAVRMAVLRRHFDVGPALHLAVADCRRLRAGPVGLQPHGRDMGVHDHGSMVWDEIVAIWLVLAFVTPTSFWGQFAAFLWFLPVRHRQTRPDRPLRPQPQGSRPARRLRRHVRRRAGCLLYAAGVRHLALDLEDPHARRPRYRPPSPANASLRYSTPSRLPTMPVSRLLEQLAIQAGTVSPIAR